MLPSMKQLLSWQKDLMSAGERSVMSRIRNSTVGYQTTVSCLLSPATEYLIVKYQFGEMELTHAISERTIVAAKRPELIYEEVAAFGQMFVESVIAAYSKLSPVDRAVALWELGIGLGGDW